MKLSAPPSVKRILRQDSASLTRCSSSSGPIRLPPLAVAMPRSLEEVRALVLWAEAESQPLVPRGAGTGMPGGNVGPGVVVDLAHLDELGQVETGPRTTAWVGAGVVAARLERLARARGMFLPPLPSSAELCTLGGMIANNAAGVRTFRHGAVRDWVEEVEVVVSGGEVLTLRAAQPNAWTAALHQELLSVLGAAPPGWPSVRKNSSGYALDRFLPTGDALQLVVGSEGTLGVITGARVRLEHGTEGDTLVLLALHDPRDLVEASALAREVGASACELLGRRIIEMAGLEQDGRFGPLAKGAEAILLLELGGPSEHLHGPLQTVRRFAKDIGSPVIEAGDANDAQELWKLRHRASPTIARAAARGLRSTQFIEDSVVGVECVPAYLEGLGDILERARTDAVVFGHLGDGNLHVNPLVDTRRRDWRGTVERVLEETAGLVSSLGGTLSGEHGDGRLRAPYLERIWGEQLTDAFRTVKKTLDPAGIFNPGVILPLPGQDPLEGLWDELEQPSSEPESPRLAVEGRTC